MRPRTDQRGQLPEGRGGDKAGRAEQRLEEASRGQRGQGQAPEAGGRTAHVQPDVGRRALQARGTEKGLAVTACWHGPTALQAAA